MSVTSRCIPRLTSDRELYSSMEIPAEKGNRNEVTCTWIGTAGLCISDSVTGILVDPYVSRFSIGPVALRRPLIPDLALVREWSQRLGGVSIRAVIVSHSHFDHAADAPYFTQETGALLVGSESTLNIGRGAGLEEKRMRLAEPGRMMKFGSFSVEFIESLHGPFLFGRIPYSGDIREPLTPPGTAADYRVGTVFSLLFRHRAGTLLHHGSAGFINGMYDRITTDVILMGIAGRNYTPGYLENVAVKTGAKLLVPIHTDNFFRPLRKGMTLLPSVAFGRFCNEALACGSISGIRTLPFGKPARVLPLTLHTP